MNWLVVPASLPGLVEFSLGSVGVFLALLAACVPAALAVRHALRQQAEPDLPQLHVVRSKELRRHAA